jgi:rhodanese-related sulfurtransferase
LTAVFSRSQNKAVPVPRISREELKSRLDNPETAARTVLLDVRLKYPYEHSTMRLPGSKRMSPDAVDVSALPRDHEIVAYDSDPDELVSSRVAAHLIKAGFTARALKGGIVDWLEAKFPTEAKDAPKAAAPEPGSLKG